jgi:hypothetical protein
MGFPIPQFEVGGQLTRVTKLCFFFGILILSEFSITKAGIIRWFSQNEKGFDYEELNIFGPTMPSSGVPCNS